MIKLRAPKGRENNDRHSYQETEFSLHQHNFSFESLFNWWQGKKIVMNFILNIFHCFSCIHAAFHLILGNPGGNQDLQITICFSLTCSSVTLQLIIKFSGYKNLANALKNFVVQHLQSFSDINPILGYHKLMFFISLFSFLYSILIHSRIWKDQKFLQMSKQYTIKDQHC